jgi:hypothetical protein
VPDAAWFHAEAARLRERLRQLQFDYNQVLRELSETERQERMAVARERGPSEF